jgi:hypothetical protein
VVPQPATINSHANKNSTANFFIIVLEIEIPLENTEMHPHPSMDVRQSKN